LYESGDRQKVIYDELEKQMSDANEVWKDLAGPAYLDMVRSKEAAFEHLFNPDSNVRIAAINICASRWECSGDAEFVNACRTLAAVDIDTSVRAHAISALGEAFRETRDSSISQFLADTITLHKKADELGTAAYWALREVQVGLTEEDLIKRSIAFMKDVIRKARVHGIESQVRDLLVHPANLKEELWNSAEQIDWDFVDRYSSRK
jgi:hypothetical protein